MQFHGVKTVVGKVVAQSIFLSGINILAKGRTAIGSMCIPHTSPHSAGMYEILKKV